MLTIHLVDDQFPKKPVNHTRPIARGLVMDSKGNVAIHLIERDDSFGKCSYYETPGGGIDDGETPEIAFIRECQEEIGCQIEIEAKIGIVTDYYNLIGRKNINHFFLAKKIGDGEKHFVSSGDSLIKKTLWVSIDEAISLYEKVEESPLPTLVKRRELPILLEAKKILGLKNNL